MFLSGYGRLHYWSHLFWRRISAPELTRPQWIVNHRSLAQHTCCRPSWKSSASLIVTFKQTLTEKLQEHLPINFYSSVKFLHDYHVLLFKRPHSSPSFKGKIVFPGGVVSEVDFSQSQWNQLIPVDVQFEVRSRPPIYLELARRFRLNDKSDSLDPSVGLRLCALRELFEETGLLLVETDRTERVLESEASPFSSVTNAVILEENEMRFWQDRLSNEPISFPQLYTHLGYKPPLGALYDWSNWLTPQKFHPRYDTLFYFVHIDSVLSQSDRATSNRKWQSHEVGTLYADSPAAFLYSSTRSLVPPQIYELGRLAQFIRLETLTAFARQRATLGCRRWCPISTDLAIAGQRCAIYFLPGDQRYDQLLTGSNRPVLTAADLAQDTHRNRLVLSSDATQLWYDTTVYELGHVTPVTRAEYRSLLPNTPLSQPCV